MVNTVTVSDIMSGNAQLPFLNRNSWKAAQQNCPDMRRAFAHLTQGTQPSRKARHLKHLRKYLNVATVDRNGLIVVRKQDPLLHERTLIVVPYNILSGIITAMHIYLKHPTRHQLTKVFNRYFYGITSNIIIADIVNQCDQCNVPFKLVVYQHPVGEGGGHHRPNTPTPGEITLNFPRGKGDMPGEGIITIP